MPITVKPEEVNERTTPVVTISFKDEDEAPAIPSSASYRIDDHGSEVQILDNTVITPLDSTIEIKLTQEHTRILTPTNDHEIRRITVWWAYGSSKYGNGECFLKVLNLKGIPDPTP